MVDWAAGTNDASAAERLAAFIPLRVPGSPDVFKEAAVADFLTKDASGNVSLGGTPPGTAYRMLDIQGLSAEPAIYMRATSATGGTLEIAQNHSVSQVNFTSSAFQMRFNVNGGHRLAIGTTGHITPGADNTQNLGSGALRMAVLYAGTGTINTSDERAKTEIGDITDAWLDAWADVEWQQFKFINGSRWHIGLVAQAVHSAFAGHGLDAFEIGLCCYDAWEEQREPIFDRATKTRLITAIEQELAGEDENGEPLFRMREVEVEEEYQELTDTGKTRVTLEAGDRWGLRYDECQAIEAAWQRRELARMATRLAALESGAE